MKPEIIESDDLPASWIEDMLYHKKNIKAKSKPDIVRKNLIKKKRYSRREVKQERENV